MANFTSVLLQTTQNSVIPPMSTFWATALCLVKSPLVTVWNGYVVTLRIVFILGCVLIWNLNYRTRLSLLVELSLSRTVMLLPTWPRRTVKSSVVCFSYFLVQKFLSDHLTTINRSQLCLAQSIAVMGLIWKLWQSHSYFDYSNPLQHCCWTLQGTDVSLNFLYLLSSYWPCFIVVCIVVLQDL